MKVDPLKKGSHNDCEYGFIKRVRTNHKHFTHNRALATKKKKELAPVGKKFQKVWPPPFVKIYVRHCILVHLDPSAAIDAVDLDTLLFDLENYR